LSSLPLLFSGGIRAQEHTCTWFCFSRYHSTAPSSFYVSSLQRHHAFHFRLGDHVTIFLFAGTFLVCGDGGSRGRLGLVRSLSFAGGLSCGVDDVGHGPTSSPCIFFYRLLSSRGRASGHGALSTPSVVSVLLWASWWRDSFLCGATPPHSFSFHFVRSYLRAFSGSTSETLVGACACRACRACLHCLSAAGPCSGGEAVTRILEF
jgi:hypothetical protein